MKNYHWILSFVLFALPSTVTAAETVSYQYDALGRVVRVVHSGGPATGVTTVYVIDPVDNRTNVTLTGGH